MKLRSPRELGFRAHQYAFGTLDYAFAPPKLDSAPHRLPLPDANTVTAALRDSRYSEELCKVAEKLMAHKFPVFDRTIRTGTKIDWRRDYHNGISTPVLWFKRIPFLDFRVSGDHKYIWEINRHQHLVVLAQAWNLSGDSRYLGEIEMQIRSWNAQNPFLQSVNWASALEVAFRALSWIWVLHLAGPAVEPGFQRLIGTLLLRHGVAISHNLSTYFAPNTHILGEGVALHAIGLALGKTAWTKQGASIVEREMRRQVQADGLHFEQSTYYQVYALDMLLFHYLLAERPKPFEPVLRRMAKVCELLLDGARTMPLIGDDDGGRFFHPYGSRARFANATLATCAALFPDLQLPACQEDLAEQAYWWLGPVSIQGYAQLPVSEHLALSGLSIFRKDGVHATFDGGPFSSGGAGHSHADTLAVTLRVDGHDVLIDPGTYTYVADPKERDWFRGTGAHSTVRLGGSDQGVPANPFRWQKKPAVKHLVSENYCAAAECSYREWRHSRLVDFREPDVLCVEDSIVGPRSAIAIEQNWHSAFAISRLSQHRFAIGPSVFEVDPRLRAEILPAFRSKVFGSREPSFILRCVGDTPVDKPLRTVIHLRAAERNGE